MCSSCCCQNGLDVLRVDEEMLDQTYHWLCKNMASVIRGGLSHHSKYALTDHHNPLEQGEGYNFTILSCLV